MQPNPLENGFSYVNITSNTTTTVKSIAGILHAINVNKSSSLSGMATLYDNTIGSGKTIGTIDTSSIGSHAYDIQFNTGLVIVTTGGATAPDLTISYF